MNQVALRRTKSRSVASELPAASLFSAECLFVSLSTEDKGAFLMCVINQQSLKKRTPHGTNFWIFKSKYNFFYFFKEN